jgi:type 1 glutamine amidotransferase
MRLWITLACLLANALHGAEAVNPLRTRSEVAAALAKPSAQPNPNPKPLQLVLVASKQDHGPGEHDYPSWQKAWNTLLSGAQRVSVTNAWLWPSPEQFETSQALVFYCWNHSWTPERFAQIDAYLDRGGGIVLLHSSSIADQDPEALAEHIGISFQPQRSKYRHGELDLNLLGSGGDPLTRGLPPTIHFRDETYWPMIGDTNKARILATTVEEGKPWPMVWTFQRGKGRLFGTVLGHYLTTYDDPFFRVMILRAIAWSAGEPVSRLEPHATVGVHFKD